MTPDGPRPLRQRLTRRDFAKRTGILATALGAAPVWLPSVAREALVSGPTTNGIANPRVARDVAGWGAYNPGGTDPVPRLRRRRDGVGGGTTSAEIAFSPSGGERRAVLYPDFVAVDEGKVIWGEAMAKVISASPGAALTLRFSYFNAAGDLLAEPTVATISRPATGWHHLAGFDTAPPGAARFRVLVGLDNTVRPRSTVRATNFMAVLDPPGLPSYFDGSYPECAWLGGAHASASTGPPPLSARPAHRSFLFGFNDNSTQTTSGVTPAIDVALNKEIGASVLRISVNLASAAFQSGPGERIDWTDPYVQRYDALYRECVRAGVKFLPIALFCPPWMGVSQGDPPPNEHLAEWTRLPAQLAERWPRAVAIEVWNEPNLGASFWRPAADAAAYTTLLSETYEAIKAVEPSMTVLTGGLSGIRVSDGPSQALHEYLRGMYEAGARGNFDGHSVHVYPQRPSSADLEGPLETVRTIQRQNDDHRPLWVTEIGTSTGVTGEAFAEPVSETQQGFVNRLAYGMLKRQGDVHAVCFHTLLSPSSIPSSDFEAGFEVVERETMRRKPAFWALESERWGERERRAA